MRAGDSVSIDIAQIDAIAARFAASGGQPGLAYGVVADGQLVHSGGCGVRRTGGPVPDAGTVFRIASMTKSFTATTLLLLRDRGALRLDDPVQDYVPEVRGVQVPAADCSPLTIRQLLTMTAGFPTDDPWGDRQQGLEPAVFARLLAHGGVRCAWAPGTRFEYSNLGYAILGKVIETATGMDYARVIRAEVLGPLGLDMTGFEAAEFDPAQLACGYRREAGGWLQLEPDPSGAFAPMGGIFSCVQDLARWVAGFADAFPARDGADSHPLSRASRREMQLAQVAIVADADASAARFSGPASVSYGFGLFAEDDPAIGAVVQHSGGYPGYGSHMRWHPETGLGAIVLANSTYAYAGALARELLAELLGAEDTTDLHAAGFLVRGPAPAPGGPWPETLAASRTVNDLLLSWDEEVASRLFAANVALDRPFAERRADIVRLRDRIGQFRPDENRPAEFDSPAHSRWWLSGERGTVSVQVRLAPLREPLVQQLILALPPATGSALHQALHLLVGVLNDDAADWPAGLAAAESVDPARVLRQLRMASAWAGRSAIDFYSAGNGETSVTARLIGATGGVVLTVDITDSSGEVRSVEVSLVK
jgi:CubicO group peptidase (beta-lactamase class C family)